MFSRSEVLGQVSLFRDLGPADLVAVAARFREDRFAPIAHILLKLASKFGEESPEGRVIRTSLTRQDIADLADTTTETAIRVMSRFSKDGIVRTLRGGYVLIVDQPALERIGD